MKKIRQNIYSIFMLIILLVHLSCSSNKFVQLTQASSIYPIILVKGNDNKSIVSVRIPLVFHISSNSSGGINLGHVSYMPNSEMYKSEYSGASTLYISKNKELQISVKLEEIGFVSRKFIIYTYHRSNYERNDKFGQFLQPYFDYIVEKDKDTLHISSIQELKKTNPEILNAFLQGDSLLFRFHKGKSIFTRTFPVEIK